MIDLKRGSTPETSFAKRFGLILGFLALFAIMLMPVQPGLPVAGQRMLAILVFSVIVWLTDCISYPASAAVILTLMVFLLGISPDPANPKVLMGTTKGLAIALGGFSNSATALIAGALFIAAAMVKTGLDKRIALFVLSKIGAKTNRILMGVIFISFLLHFFIPSTTARVACMVPIVLGIIAAFGVDRRSKFAGMLMIATPQADTIWNSVVKTSVAQNMIATGFIEKQLGVSISWGEWLFAALPYGIITSIGLYYLMLKMMPPEKKEIEGGKEIVAKAFFALGPMSFAEKKMLLISCVLLGLWATEKILHPIDTTSSTIAAIAVMLLPGIGIMTWKEAEPQIPWGTLVLIGIGISLGTGLLSTKAAVWVGNWVVAAFGLETMPGLGLIAILAAFLIIIHLGFSNATALCSAMIPIIISILQNSKVPGLNLAGIAMILQYTVSMGYILPVNAPQNMVAYGTNTFDAKDFIKIGLLITIIAYGVIILLSATYWKWLGFA
jgi:anion transporter